MTEDSIARRILIVAAIAGVCVLAACQRGGDESKPEAGTRPQAKKQLAPTDSAPDAAIAEANRKMAAGVPVGASTAPVEVRFEIDSAPVAGEPFDISVAVLPGAPTPVLHIEVRASEGLIVVAPDGPVSIEKVQAGTLERLAVKASSARTGTRVLSVKVTLELPSGAQSRDFAFPLLIGTAGGASAPPHGKNTG
jgi:hypothetical protein